MEQDEDFSTLSLDEKVVHKSWKARQSAYDELSRKFRVADSPKDIIFRNFSDVIKRCPLESNAIAQENALSCMLAYFESCDVETGKKLRPEITAIAIEKGLSAARAGTRSKTIELLMILIELDVAEPVVQELLPFFAHKQPKLVAACVNCLSEIVRNYGAEVAGAKTIIKSISPVFQHADKSVRAEATALVVELSRWLGSGFVAVLQGLKPVQLKELQELCGQQNTGSASPTRYLRSQKHLFQSVAMACDSSEPVCIDDSMEDVVVTANVSTANAIPKTKPATGVLDAYDLADAVHINALIPSNLSGQLSSAAWKDRKEALDNLLTLLKVPRIAADDYYNELVDGLCKRIADINVMVVVVAANCLEALENGLRSSFAPYRHPTLLALLDRCKEKKANVVEALRSALDGLKYCIPQLVDILPDVTSFLAHKNPSVKAETLLFLARQMKLNSSHPPSKKDCKALISSVLPAMDDGVTEVRDAAAEVLAFIFKHLGEPNAVPLLEKLDKIKLNKVKELAGKLESPTVKPAYVATAAKAGSALPSIAPPAKATTAVMPISVPARKIPAEDVPIAAPAAKIHRPQQAIAEDLTRLAYVHTDEEAFKFFVEAYGESLVNNLGDPAWKTRLQAAEDLAAQIDEGVELPLGFSTEMLARFVSQRPGWKESNFQILGKVLACLLKASKAQFYTREAVAICVAGLVEKLSDPKLRNDCNELFMIFAEHSSLGFTIAQVVNWTRAQKSPKIQADQLKWLQSAIEAFGVTGCNVADLVDLCKSCLQNSNATVRSVAVGLVGTLRSFVGPDLRLFFNDLNSALLAIIDSEFTRISNDPAPIPKRQALGVSAPVLASTIGSTTNPLSTTSTADDMIPRVNITTDVNDGPLTKLENASWKIRKEGLDEISQLLTSANFRVKYTGTELFSGLKARLNDTNKNLIIQALDVCGQLADSMGTAFNKVLHVILLPVIETLSDNKVQIRQAALKALDKFHYSCPTAMFLSAIGASVAPECPNTRKEILIWGSSALLSSRGPIPKEDLIDIVANIADCLQDRTGDVRKAAQGFIAGMLDHVSAESLKKAFNTQRPKLLPALAPILDANKGRLKASVSMTSISSAPDATHVSPTSQLQAPRTPTRSMTMKVATANRTITPIKFNASLHNLPDEAARAGNDESVLLTADSSLKQTRADRDRGMQKWAFETPRKDIADFLREQMLGNISYALVGKLFSEDFKDQILALNRIEDYLQLASDDDTKAKFLANTDLLLKYLTLRFFDTNTSVLIKSLELTEGIFRFMDSCNYRISEYEASCFLPFLISKMGDGKEAMRMKIHSIFRQVCRIYPASKLFLFFVDGLKSKNSRVRSECLDELANLVSRNGLSVLQPSKHLPFIGSLISDRDSNVRNGALKVLVQVNQLMGTANLQKHLQNISSKDLDLLDERLKRAAAGMSAYVPEEDGLLAHDVDMECQPITHVVETVCPEKLSSLELCSNDQITESGSLYMADPTALVLPTPILPTIRRSFEPSRLSHPLDQAIDQIQFSTDLVCIHALQQLETILNAASDSAVLDPELEGRIDAMMHALIVRLKEATTVSMEIPDIAQMKSRLCRYVMNALVLVAANAALCRALSQDLVELLLSESLTALISDRLPQFEDHEQLERALNLLVVKSLENIPVNRAYRGLLSILAGAFRTAPAATDKFPELVMKCLWKMTKQIGAQYSSGHITVSDLLLDVHQFLVALPPIEWKMRATDKLPCEDLPLRTVKTILHELVQVLELNILKHMTLIPDPEESFVFSYLRAMLLAKDYSNEQILSVMSPHYDMCVDSEGHVKEGSNAARSSTASPSKTETKISDSAVQHRSELSSNEIDAFLRDVCTQICSKPDTRVGLQQLYDFRTAHPYALAQINNFLISLGDFFFKYITRALDRLHSEHLQRAQAGALASSFDGVAASDVSVEMYKNKLVQLRQQIFGYESSNDSLENQPPSSVAASPALRRSSTLYESPKMRAIRLAPSNPSSPTKLSSALDFATSSGANQASDMSQSPGGTSSILSLKERLAKLRGDAQHFN